MRRVGIYTSDGRYVATVEIPPFPDSRMPKAVLWGSRVFCLEKEPPAAGNWQYSEVFAVASTSIVHPLASDG